MKWSIEQRALLSDRDDTDAGQITLILGIREKKFCQTSPSCVT